ncbi:hypothetical protein PUNSTDRAFT_140302 [Punctularia strigosozonata HHB-11173 SS5]|uniref:uncharacterized protein n=1 Tax=Punctularia strigosozonata (strain HHB-11173) TaxID=741275 RepID=UPI0004418010|nr:uncharacterized protein PUNSTDRAFT_140302 [Punctularia strigosozonata HHB-11173 SS5]EIN13861.1 hypothetical protein PUNSTDRAFT_140302 [Punctularia strigosozonata HHB-11173 SS5]
MLHTWYLLQLPLLIGVPSLLNGVLAQTPDNTTTLPVGSCTATIPCSNGACCNAQTGFCGLASVELQQSFAKLDVSHSASPPPSSLAVTIKQVHCIVESDTTKAGQCQQILGLVICIHPPRYLLRLLRTVIGSYIHWNMATYDPPVNYAFALISEEFQIMEMAVNDNVLWLQTTALKKRNPALKVFLSIGGWSFNDPPTQHIFSNMVGSADATNTFISSALSIMQAYSFDGLDIDWEYPVANERGGVPADRANYPIFMSKLKAAFKPRGYGLSFTAPSSYWYLQHFDLPLLLQSADWVNVMTYDLHGVWDGTDPYIGPVINAHTNLTEIKSTMQLFRNVGVDPSQIVLGIGFYGRSFQLADPSCSAPGCPFVGGADPGVCSLNSGTLMFSEIEQIIDDNNLIPVFDDIDAFKYITWNEDQWVSYDDSQTLEMKLDYANSICLGAGYANCGWVGDPPNCLNAACEAGQVAIFTDMQGDASTSCVGNNKRYYCCDPPSGSQFLPVPENWVFPQNFENSDTYDVSQPATFTVDFDDNTGTSDTSSSGSGSSGVNDDGTEDDSAFGEVFISSPNPASVSSLDVQSDWVLTKCSASSDEAQEVLAYCTKGMDDEDSGCGHVFLGHAEHTIVRMPKSCGLGPYARVISLEVHPDQGILPAEHKNKKRSTELVYSLKFDYNFLAIPESNGPVLMRADMTDIPGYWNEIVNTAPDSGTTTTRRRKRDYHRPIEYEKRWFGPFDDWLAKLTTVRSRNSIDRNFHWSDTYTIYHAEEQCPNFSSSMDISVTGSASVSSSFGYYLEASIVPPQVQQCYVFFQAGAQAQASFTIKGLAEAHFDSSRSELASFGFPGLYYPGLLTLGPSLHLYGQLSGQLSLSGQITTSVGYTFPSIDVSFGKQDSDNDEENESSPVTPDANNQGYDFSVGYNVNLEGSVDAHIVPSLQIGVNVLGGSLIDAQLFTEADIYGGVGITGSVSQSSAAQFCVNPHFGVALNAGLTGSVLFWRSNPRSWTFYSNEFPFGGNCFSSVDQPSSASGKRSEDTPYYVYEASGTAGQGSSIDTRHALAEPARAEHNLVALLDGEGEKVHALNARANISDELHPTILAESTLKVCPFTIPIPAYSDTQVQTYFDLEHPGELDPTYSRYNPLPINTGTTKGGLPALSQANSAAIYAREHVYEQSMSALFVDYLAQFPALWQNSANNKQYCDWVTENLMTVTVYYPGVPVSTTPPPTVFNEIGQCYPGGREGGNAMVVLEQQANVFKNTLLYDGERRLNNLPAQVLMDSTEFSNYCPTKQISKLRAAAGVPSYMNDYTVKQNFLENNACIRDTWKAWYAAYSTSNVDAPNKATVNVPNIYDNWISNVVSGMVPYLKSEITRLIALYNDKLTTAAEVDLSFAILLDNAEILNRDGDQMDTGGAAFTIDRLTTQQDLTDAILNDIPDITWAASLPRH